MLLFSPSNGIRGLAFLSLMLGATSICGAASVTYDVSGIFGNGSNTPGNGAFTGTMTTDGTIGVLDPDDIVSWSFTIYGNGEVPESFSDSDCNDTGIGCLYLLNPPAPFPSIFLQQRPSCCSTSVPRMRAVFSLAGILSFTRSASPRLPAAPVPMFPGTRGLVPGGLFYLWILRSRSYVRACPGSMTSTAPPLSFPSLRRWRLWARELCCSHSEEN
jgi:hypothetical protein